MNCLVYCENSNLFIRKPNGLEYQFDNVDAPALGFKYDVIVYDDIEIKIENWDDSKSFEQQEQLPLTESDIQAVEDYIKISEPPVGVTLQSQYAGRLKDLEGDAIQSSLQTWGFSSVDYVLASARSGSNHPQRSNARRVLEYFDAVGTVIDGIINEIYATREDILKPFEDYMSAIPRCPDHPDRPQ